jgi:hypothetical protein
MRVNVMYLIYIGVLRIYVITYYYKVVVGLGSHQCTLLEVRVLRVGMLTLDTTPFLYTKDRGFQVPMTLEYDKQRRSTITLGVSISESFEERCRRDRTSFNIIKQDNIVVTTVEPVSIPKVV